MKAIKKYTVAEHEVFYFVPVSYKGTRSIKIANVFIHQVQSGDVKADPTKTLCDYITEYMISDRTKRITEFASAFGLPSQDLIDFMKLDITESNIDDFGRLSVLKEKVNRDIAKSYLEQKEGTQISAFKLSMKIDSVLRAFILSDGKGEF